MRRRAHALVLSAVVPVAAWGLLTASATAHAAVRWNWSRATSVAFSGDVCGSVSTLRAPADTGASDLVLQEPALSDSLMDESGARVARITEVARRTQGDGLAYLAVTAMGSDDVCINPLLYAGVGWATTDVLLRVRYTRRERVYFNEFYAEGDEARTRERPGRIHGGSDFGWIRVRWRTWGGRRALGRAFYYYVQKDVVPYVVHRYPVRVVFDRPGACYGRIRYLRMTTTYTARRPTYGGRTVTRRRERHRLTCSRGLY